MEKIKKVFWIFIHPMRKMARWLLSSVKEILEIIIEDWMILLPIAGLICFAIWVLVSGGFFSSGGRPTYNHLYRIEQIIDSNEDQMLAMADSLAEEMLDRNNMTGSPLIREEYPVSVVSGTSGARKFEYIFLTSPDSGWWRFGVICEEDGDHIRCVTHPLDRTY